MSAAVTTNGLFLLYCNHKCFLQGGPKIYLLQEKTRLCMTQSNNCEITDVLGSLPSCKLCSDWKMLLKNGKLYDTK